MNYGDRTLWMGDLEKYMDATFIGQAFERMGEEVQAVKMVHDKYTGLAAGYCFVELADGDAARRAMLNVNGKVIPDSKPPSTFNLSFANSPSAPYTEYNLFVNNIPLDLDDAGLFLVFGDRYRSCRGAKVYRNGDGGSRGLGFVRFADQTDQQMALVEMNKMVVHGKELVLKLAQPKFRAPRGAHGVPNYDPSNHYPRYQEFYNSHQWQMYDYAAQPVQQMYIQQPVVQQMTMASGGDGAALVLQPATYMTTGGVDYQQQQQQMMQIPSYHQQPTQYMAPVSGSQQQMLIEDNRYAQSATSSSSGPKTEAPNGTGGGLMSSAYESELESHEASTMEESNCACMLASDDLYGAMERSRWFPQLHTAAVCEADIVS